MTALMEPAGQVMGWNSMPGWGVVAELTPPELVAMRRLVSLRKVIAAALGVVVIACVGGYILAGMRTDSAQSGLDAANDRATQLLANQHKYANVTQLQAATQSINGQIATLMKTDVDVAKTIARVRSALPGSMSLTSLDIQVSAGDAGDADTTGSLNTTGHQMIGTATLAGQSNTLADLAGYVTELSGLPGVVNVVPTSNSRGTGKVASWNVTLNLTDQLYTHRYEVKSTGGSR